MVALLRLVYRLKYISITTLADATLCYLKKHTLHKQTNNRLLLLKPQRLTTLKIGVRRRHRWRRCGRIINRYQAKTEISIDR